MLTKRDFLTGLMAVGCLTPAGRTAADGMMPMRAIRQFALGDMKITIIDDGSFTMGVGMFGSNAPEGAVGDLMAQYGLARDKAEIPLQVMLVDTGGMRVLIDTGMGDVTFSGNEPDNGRLVRSLETLGITASDIDLVILTHGHPDHVGGLTTNGEQTFLNAGHLLPQVEFDFWTQSPSRAPVQLREMITECRRHLLPVERVLLSYSDGRELAPGIRAVAAPGHTHGHFALMLESRGERLLHLVDTSVHYIAGLERPDWSVGADIDKPTAIRTRRRLLAQAAEEQLLIAGYHFPFPGIGRVLPMGDGYRYVPMPLV